MWVQALGQSLETLQSLEILKLSVSENYGVGESAGRLVSDFMPALKNLKEMSLFMMGVHMNDTTLQHVGDSIGASCENLQVERFKFLLAFAFSNPLIYTDVEHRPVFQRPSRPR